LDSRIIIFSILLAGTIGVANAESVPDWVKNTAGWWATDAISENEFVNAIEFLANEGIISVESSSNVAKSNQSVPDWVKNTAGWWATNAISENEFVNAIEFLANEGIIEIENDCKFNRDGFSHLYEDMRMILCDDRFSEEFFQGKAKESGDMGGTTADINSHGFRGPEITKEKSDNVFRIFLVGGSTINGWGVSFEDTIGNIMQEELNSLGFSKQIQVINAGIGGASSKDETELVKNKISEFEPDMIIVYDGWNDSLKSLGVILEYDSTSTPSNWVQRWDEVCQIFNQKDVDIIITLQPILRSSENRILTDHENAMYVTSTRIGHGITLSTLDAFASQLNNFEQCKNTHDLRKIFDDVVQPIFLDTGHVGKIGNKAVSYEFISIVKPLIEEKIGKSDRELFLDYDNKIGDVKQIEVSFEGDYSSNIEFTEKTIHRYSFEGAELITPKFIKSMIDNSNLRFAIIDNGIFEETQIKDSIFARGITYQSDVINSIIQDSNFSGISFNQVWIEDSEVYNSKFEGSVWGATRMQDSTIENSDFSRSFLKDSEFYRTEFISANFEKSAFMKVLSKDIIYEDVNFNLVDFPGSEFHNSRFSNVDFYDADFAIKATTPNTYIPGTIFKNSIFTDVNFDDANFNELELEEFSELQIELASVHNPKFIESDFYNVDFSGLDLNFVSFTKSDLTDINFKNSSLRFANLEGANLEGANLEGANLKCINHVICE